METESQFSGFEQNQRLARDAILSEEEGIFKIKILSMHYFVSNISRKIMSIHEYMCVCVSVYMCM